MQQKLSCLVPYHRLFLDTSYIRITQTEQLKLSQEDTDICEIQKIYRGHIAACAVKRVCLINAKENKTLFLEHTTRESKSYRKAVKKRLSGLYFREGKLITLTTAPSFFANSRTAMCENIKQQWNQLRTALKRKYGDFRFLCVLEFTKSNLPHLHVVTDIIKKVSLKTLHGNWEKQGKQIRVSHFRQGINVSNYVLKYVTKAVDDESMALMWFYHLRSYTLSRNAYQKDIYAQFEKIDSGYAFLGSVKIIEAQLFFHLNLTEELPICVDGIFERDDNDT